MFLYGSDRLLNDEVDRFVALLVFAVDIVLAGHDGVQDDADDGADSQTREADCAEMERACRGVADADGQNQDEGRDQNVAGLGEIDLVLDDVAHADRGDHTVEHKADAADGAAGHGGDDGRELRAEGEEHGQDCRDADDARVIDAAEGQNAGVFAVGRVGRRAEEGSQRGRKTVAHQGAVQAGVVDVVVANGGADGGDVTDVLHHGSQSDGDDGEQGADELGAAVDGKEAHGFLVERDAEPCGGGNALKVHGTGHKGHCVGDENADQDGQDLDHTLAPDVADDDRTQSHKGQQPVGLAVGDGRGSKDQTDGDNDGAGDHRREELHDAADAKGGDQQAGHQIDQTRECNSSAGIRQHLGVGNGQVAIGISQHGSHDGEAAQIRKGGAEECRDLLFGDEVEQQRAQTCAEQCGADAQAVSRGTSTVAPNIANIC